MKHYITYFSAMVVLALSPSLAFAQCNVEYKAKQDNPLRLEHGTLVVDGPCTKADVKDKVEATLDAKGWTLLKVLSVSDN